MDLSLLKTLAGIHAPSGCEYHVKNFLLEFIQKEQKNWEVTPTIVHGEEFQDCIILVFGQPRTAVYAHMDSVGYTVSYKNDLIKIGGPQAKEGTILIGEDSQGKIAGKLIIEEKEDYFQLKIDFNREIDRGTCLVYQQDFIQTEEYVQSCYLDNRLGMWVALELCKTLRNGAIVFSAWEEVGGGSVGYLASYLYDHYKVKQALIADITWVTPGIQPGSGVAISLRDSGIPRKSYLEQILELMKPTDIKYQLEVESAGGSDGNALQKSPFPIDWCFIGAAEENVHCPDERVNLKDIKYMLLTYRHLLDHL